MCSASKYLSVALLIEWSSCSLCESQTLFMALWHCEPTHEGPSYSFVIRLVVLGANRPAVSLQTHLNAPCVSILIVFFVFCFFLERPGLSDFRENIKWRFISTEQRAICLL